MENPAPEDLATRMFELAIAVMMLPVMGRAGVDSIHKGHLKGPESAHLFHAASRYYTPKNRQRR